MFYPSIGLEIHVELDTKSKMFCSCKNDAKEKSPNTNICPICLGHPGTLPVINIEAVKKVIKVGLSLGSTISKESFFDRKSYFYPDLPKGYQISQKYFPLCQGGHLEVNGKEIRINEIHLEEDTCRLIHSSDNKFSLLDCNRAGLPLMELVTKPDLESAKQVKNFAQNLHLLLRYLNVSEADMEKGQMRIEVNISLSSEKGKLGTKVELKNINSFRSAERATIYEIKRQTGLLEKGEKVIQQTRGWNADKEETFQQRIKETSDDYRYFPEPDLPVLVFKKEFLDEIKSKIPELPWQKRTRLSKEYYLSEEDVEILVQNMILGAYFERVISELPPRLTSENLRKMIKLCLNYLTTDLMSLLKEGLELSADSEIPITAENFSELMMMIFEKKISSKTGKDILKEMFVTGQDPSQIVRENKLSRIQDKSKIETIIHRVVAENPKAVSDFRSGQKNALEFLLGRIMIVSHGKVDPDIARNLLEIMLSKD